MGVEVGNGVVGGGRKGDGVVGGGRKGDGVVGGGRKGDVVVGRDSGGGGVCCQSGDPPPKKCREFQTYFLSHHRTKCNFFFLSRQRATRPIFAFCVNDVLTRIVTRVPSTEL